MPEKVAIVTGGGRGIGRGIVLSLAERGWIVIMNYHINQISADETAGLAEELEGKVIAIQADIARSTDRDFLIKETLRRVGQIDVLVNNAGMAPRQRVDILETSESSYDEVMTVNLKGPFFLTQQVARIMVDSPATSGETQKSIINIGSISAFTSSPHRAEYCLSKAGLGMMTALFADRLAKHGINVYEIRPGIIKTDMTSAVQEKYNRLITDGLTPIRRWGQPDDVARAAAAIAEGLLPFSTGEIIHVDGGFHLHRL